MFQIYVSLPILVGDTDGIFEGRRYFEVPKKYGKIVKITRVLSVLDSKVGLRKYYLHVITNPGLRNSRAYFVVISKLFHR